jgi:anion-transporting  ArsA/GET3 family ATPase
MAQGRRVLLTSLGPNHGLGAALGLPLNHEPQQVLPGLDACSLDSPALVRSLWERLRGRISGPLAQLSPDEIPLLPGADTLLGAARILALAQNYDVVVVDAGPADGLLRSLCVPDGFRWGLRLGLGLDRDPGRSPQSQQRSLIPSALLPPAWIAPVQEARVRLEAARDQFAAAATALFVLPPEAGALEAARLAIPGLQLYGMHVSGLVCGPLIPTDVADERLAPLAAAQTQVAAEAAELWAPLPTLLLSATAPEHGADALAALGARIFGDTAIFVRQGSPPVEILAEPALALRLPGLPKGQLQLALSGDELIVGVGPYRRHLLLPASLRGARSIRASREGDTVVIRVKV